MKLSTRGRYGTRVLLDLALHRNEGLILLRDIADRQQISLRYLEHIITPLVSARIIRSIRGAKGGVTLLKAPDQIKLSDVILLLEGSLAPVECVDNPGICKRSDACATRDVWQEIKTAVLGVLDSKTVQDLVEIHLDKQEDTAPMYYL